MILPVFLPHLGCGQRCIYCNQDHITNRAQRGGIEPYLASLFGPVDTPVEIALYGGNVLGLDAPQLERLFVHFEPYREKIESIRLSARPGRLAGQISGILREHGVRTIELGSPTFNDRILGLLQRGHTKEDLISTYRFLRDEGFQVGLQVMVGLPEERPDDLRETVLSVTSLAPSFIRIYPLVVIEDTPLFQLYQEGRFLPDPLETAVAKAAYIYVNAWKQGIRTIKMGLTENEVLKEKVASGPYHPAFGYLVKSEAFYLAIVRKSEKAGFSGSVRVLLHPSDAAHLFGNKRTNVSRLKDRGIFPDWAEDGTMSRDHFMIEAHGRRASGSIADALAMLPF